MSRSSAFRAVAAGLLLATAVAAVQAAPVYLIDATIDGNAPDPGFANVGFSLTYEDADGNQKFSLGELLAFTGVSNGSDYFDQLLGLPSLAGLDATGTDWVFGNASGATWTADADMFTPYTSGPLPGSVPEPGSFALGATCLAALGLTRRRMLVRYQVAAAEHRE